MSVDLSPEQNLGICIVGCGMMGTIHAACWQQLPHARVVAVADLREERAQQLAQACGVERWTTDYHEAIARPDVDVVSICVPTYLHADIGCFAAAHGKHILCEKPLALTVEGAVAMAEAARQAGVRLGVAFMRPHSPVVPALHDWLKAGRVGRPVLYEARDYRELRPKREMHDVRANGGPVIDMGVHLFDLWARIFEADPVEVFARGFCFARGRPELASIAEVAVDTADITVTYSSGDIGHFSVCWGLPPGVNPESLPDSILGPRGYAHISFGRTQQELRACYEGGVWETLVNATDDMYRQEIAAFAHAVRHPDVPFPDAGAGLRALRVALAALESMRTGKVVQVQE